MGKIEQALKGKIRRTKVNSAIINAVALTGTLAVASVAPNVLGALGKMKFLNQRRYQVKESFSRMIREGYIVLEKRNGTSYASLTPKGERFAMLVHEGALTPKKPKQWDGKWRVLVFDIEEKRRGLRDKMRMALINLGFVRLQNSVWAYPYDCEDLIILIKADLKMGQEVLYIIADTIENDGALRRRFGLSPAK
ncbi:MAG: phenylacetic acid degradation operon negative regulatory protein [Parcubacteria group bacterium Greene0714_7]|nr:MAG: phenylacetic acid degradation operon negative regulatory protein [Parcubacteria group bacterium Greene0714_7]